MGIEERWFILRVVPGREVALAERAPVLPVFVPMRSERRYNRRNRVWTADCSPAFPGYAFARLDVPSSLPKVPRDIVFGFLRNNDMSYAVVRDSEMDRVVNFLSEYRACDEVDVATSSFFVGDEVNVSFGLFSGKSIRIEKILNGGKMVVSVGNSPLPVVVDKGVVVSLWGSPGSLPR